MLEGLYKRRKTNRFDVLFYIVAGIFIVLALRLMTLQILSGGYYQAKAEGNRLRMVSMTAARGIMYDRNGQILVGSRPAYTISILPTGKALDEGEVAKLAALLKMKSEDITKKVNDHKYGYEPIRIANDISMDVVTSIEEHRHELPGVTIDVEPLRYYPYETMASQLFGYVGEVSEEELEELTPIITRYFDEAEKEAVRNLILNENIRLDGRNTTQIRPIWCEVGYLPSAHGSSIFTRGETQSLTTVTLGTSREANVIDLPSEQGEERFYLHYNFPPFSTGEARPLRGTSRREIGHGNLAQRALKRMIPEDCPYTVRVVSEILESNGSSSMATVCAGTLALMDSGVQMVKPVSGIAMGLITDGERYAVLSDILGDEDHLGDMDFKVTGTADGITACQMDIKIKGLSYEILEKALNQAREGRMHILGKITDTIAKPNPTVKPHAPKIVKMDMPKEYIGAFIGTGGKNIQDLQARTNTTIVVEEVGELGIIEILGTDEAGIQEAIEAVNAVKFEPVEGETYTVKVVRLVEFGAFVEFVPGKDSLLHISEVSWDRVDKIEDALKEGDIIEVKYLGIDPKTKKTRVSRKALLPRPPREDRPDRPAREDRPKSDKPYNGKPRNDRNKGHNNHQKPRQE